jgi:hypothetical protein
MLATTLRRIGGVSIHAIGHNFNLLSFILAGKCASGDIANFVGAAPTLFLKDA